MIKLDKISKYYYSDKVVSLALRKVNLDMKQGEFIAITGESGSGKSTLLNIISGLDTYEEGKLYINEKDISYYTLEELEDYRRQYIGFVFQDYNIIESYTVLQNVEMALIVQGYQKDDIRNRALELIEEVGLLNIKNRRASKLSGGEKQRTAIARAFAKDCPIIVCDEPTGNLDTEASRKVFEILKNMSKDKLVIVVTHDSETIKEYATKSVRLYDGEVQKIDELSESRLDVETNLIEPYKVRIKDTLRIALMNILSVPKKSLFTVMVILFMLTTFIFMYGSGLEQLYSSDTISTDYFNNAIDSRLVITKHDNTPFTADELNQVSNVRNVEGVINHDIVLDTTLVGSIHNHEFNRTEFIDYTVQPVESITRFDLLDGRLPKNKNEVVIDENEYFTLGDEIRVSNAAMIKKIQGLETRDYKYLVVGIVKSKQKDEFKSQMYLTIEELNELSTIAYLEHTDVFLNVGMQKEYEVLPDIRIDNRLKDNVFLAENMFFYTIIKDFGYFSQYVGHDGQELYKVDEDDLEALVRDLDFYLVGSTAFEPDPELVNISIEHQERIPNKFGNGVYMNQTTFDRVFKEDIYQPSVVTKGKFEAKKVENELSNLGYNVMYPNDSIIDNSYETFISYVLFASTFIVTLVVIYFIGYFVLKSILQSKKLDYAVYRSIGVNKKTIKKIITFELTYLAIISFVISIILLIINEEFKSFIPHILKYFSYLDYFIIILTVFLVILLISRKYSKEIFSKSIISLLGSE